MFDQRIEASVLRQYVETGAGSLRDQPADIVSDVEVERIPSAAIDMDVFSIRPEGLQGTNDVEWNLGLVGTHEHLNSEGPTVQCTNVFLLNVLEINKHKAVFHPLPSA